MNLKTETTTRTVSGAAKGGASAIRDWAITRRPAVEDVRKQANKTLSVAQKQARSTVKDARKQARRQLIQARIAAARARSGTRARASGLSAKAVGAAGAAGLAAGYFLDPESGRRRRDGARDRALAMIRRGAQHPKSAQQPKSEAQPAPNDQDLADRVKSQIFQPDDAPKGSVNVNVENGVVYLRGEVKRPDQIQKLVEQAGEVDGVAAVESLLHTP
jgi:osmotically-inducible protein OsmY